MAMATAMAYALDAFEWVKKLLVGSGGRSASRALRPRQSARIGICTSVLSLASLSCIVFGMMYLLYVCMGLTLYGVGDKNAAHDVGTEDVQVQHGVEEALHFRRAPRRALLGRKKFKPKPKARVVEAVSQIGSGVEMGILHGWSPPPPPTPPMPARPIHKPEFMKLLGHVTTFDELVRQGRIEEANSYSEHAQRFVEEVSSPPPPPPPEPPSPPPPRQPPSPPPPPTSEEERKERAVKHLQEALPFHHDQGSWARRHEGLKRAPPTPDVRASPHGTSFGHIPFELRKNYLMSDKERRRAKNAEKKEAKVRADFAQHEKVMRDRLAFSERQIMDEAVERLAENEWPPEPPLPPPYHERLFAFPNT